MPSRISISLTESFVDPDGDPLEFTVSKHSRQDKTGNDMSNFLIRLDGTTLLVEGPPAGTTLIGGYVFVSAQALNILGDPKGAPVEANFPVGLETNLLPRNIANIPDITGLFIDSFPSGDQGVRSIALYDYFGGAAGEYDPLSFSVVASSGPLAATIGPQYYEFPESLEQMWRQLPQFEREEAEQAYIESFTLPEQAAGRQALLRRSLRLSRSNLTSPSAGTQTITVTATSTYGGTVMQEFDVDYVLSSVERTQLAAPSTQMLNADSADIQFTIADLNIYFEAVDITDKSLVYTAVSDGDILATIDGAALTLARDDDNVPDDGDTETVTITATNAAGRTASMDIDVSWEASTLSRTEVAAPATQMLNADLATLLYSIKDLSIYFDTDLADKDLTFKATSDGGAMLTITADGELEVRTAGVGAALPDPETITITATNAAGRTATMMFGVTWVISTITVDGGIGNETLNAHVSGVQASILLATLFTDSLGGVVTYGATSTGNIVATVVGDSLRLARDDDNIPADDSTETVTVTVTNAAGRTASLMFVVMWEHSTVVAVKGFAVQNIYVTHAGVLATIDVEDCFTTANDPDDPTLTYTAVYLNPSAANTVASFNGSILTLRRRTDGGPVPVLSSGQTLTITATNTVGASASFVLVFGWQASRRTFRDHFKDFNSLKAAGNSNPYDVWSDGATMYVSDFGANKLFAYNMKKDSGFKVNGKQTIQDSGDGDTTVVIDGAGEELKDRDAVTIGDVTLNIQGEVSQGAKSVTVHKFDYSVLLRNGAPVMNGGNDTGFQVDGDQVLRLNAAPIRLKGAGSVVANTTTLTIGQVTFSLNGALQSRAATLMVGPIPSVTLSLDDNATVFVFSTDRDPDKDFDGLASAGNTSPTGIWSDGTTMWVADRGDDKIYAYGFPRDSLFTVNGAQAISNSDLTITTRGTGSEISDGTLIKVGDKIFTIDGAVSAGATHITVRAPGSSVIVVHGAKIITQPRRASRDIGLLTSAQALTIGLTFNNNGNPRGIWSDGETMYVADSRDIWAYPLPGASARSAGYIPFLRNNLVQTDRFVPNGIWADYQTMYASGLSSEMAKLQAYYYPKDTLFDVRGAQRVTAGSRALNVDGVGSRVESDTPLELGGRQPTQLISIAREGDTVLRIRPIVSYTYNDNVSINTGPRKDAIRDFDRLAGAENDSPRGVWSDGATMWVVDQDEDKIFAYIY